MYNLYGMPKNDFEREFDAQVQKVAYLFCWFRSRSEAAENMCMDLIGRYTTSKNRRLCRRQIGGKIRDMERMIVRLREEWEKFLKMKRKEKDQSE